MPILIEAGHHPVYLKDSAIHHGAIKINEDGSIEPTRGVSESETQSFRDGFSLALFLREKRGDTYRLFSSVSNIRGHSPNQRKEIFEIIRSKDPIDIIPIEFREAAYQIGFLYELVRSEVDDILGNIQILPQSEFGVAAMKRFKHLKKSADQDRPIDDILRWHENRYKKTGQILIDACDGDQKYSFISTPNTRQPFSWPSDKAADFVKKVGSIPLTVNGATRCGPIAAGMQIEMQKISGITGGVVVMNLYGNDDREIATKAHRGFECVDTLGVNPNGRNLFLFQSLDDNTKYNVVGIESRVDREDIPFEEAVQISISRLREHAGFPEIFLRNTQPNVQSSFISRSPNNPFRCADDSCEG